MISSIQKKIEESLKIAESLYCRLALLVGESGCGKTLILQDVAAHYGVEVTSLNLQLSSALLELTSKQRVLQLPRIMKQIADNGQSLVVLDNLEILFDKGLGQDPLRLLQDISRNRLVVASWNGTFSNGVLTYGVPGHSEYRTYTLTDGLIVNMNGTATID